MALIKLNNQSYTSGSSFLPSGTVLQVVKNGTSNQSGHITTTSNSLVDSGLSLTITPKSSTSTIIFNFSTSMTHINGTNISQTIRLYKDGSAIAGTYNGGYKFRATGDTSPYYSANAYYSETSGSTTARTYGIYFKSSISGQAIRLVHDGSSYMLQAIEIQS